MTTDAPPNEPFTLQERIQQLCEIDTQIVSLMSHTSSALSALGAPPKQSPSDPSNPSAPPSQPPSSSSQTQTFKTSMDALLSTLHTVDVHMKRQILALEEASIIKLRNDADPKTRQPVMNEDAKIVARPSLEPNGVGTIGNLDVGWLNSRNNKVERDMEAELWAKMRELLERYHAKEVAEGAGGGGGGGGGGIKDERMQD
ncbi:mediator complex protein [Colletotrichum fioriniae PJ7]|uniref:Mediator of RNA polymerase II transcription subunit 11 n=1 Tax=Colletotrichum fioriniae PJ7 TaxID=1445577 RepID=A0A010RUL4_9PEZI|nr:mediator complex protein [Colletotrichum fioriniae PJ7]